VFRISLLHSQSETSVFAAAARPGEGGSSAAPGPDRGGLDILRSGSSLAVYAKMRDDSCVSTVPEIKEANGCETPSDPEEASDTDALQIP
jgi:hypothetical protein